jgi:hypothetical protein
MVALMAVEITRRDMSAGELRAKAARQMLAIALVLKGAKVCLLEALAESSNPSALRLHPSLTEFYRAKTSGLAATLSTRRPSSRPSKRYAA